ncbi:Rho1 guanine nucleotide exchange factor 1 [Smittium culicis]|uniref:Rho1 guanine nucleotide exchange factor 1 n=1 Tax=Smittium culicis TaxID=133412 RepID=A0A1R1XKC8_9FUNG|nr:Rho1 guanine nucleotide exchange factor 1 [Smittium culicis]OMJ15091.1 Rho1 guanine nucleotide exchange factor 1 [Smittium culicis]
MSTQSLLDPADSSLNFVNKKREQNNYSGGSGNAVNSAIGGSTGSASTKSGSIFNGIGGSSIGSNSFDGANAPYYGVQSGGGKMITSGSSSIKKELSIYNGATGNGGVSANSLGNNSTNVGMGNSRDRPSASLSVIGQAKPISLFRVQSGEFLLCYSEFGFFVNRNGQRARKQLILRWESVPHSFVFSYPYIIAIDNTFIEIRNIDTGELVQILSFGENLNLLNCNGSLVNNSSDPSSLILIGSDNLSTISSTGSSITNTTGSAVSSTFVNNSASGAVEEFSGGVIIGPVGGGTGALPGIGGEHPNINQIDMPSNAIGPGFTHSAVMNDICILKKMY